MPFAFCKTKREDTSPCMMLKRRAVASYCQRCTCLMLFMAVALQIPSYGSCQRILLAPEDRTNASEISSEVRINFSRLSSCPKTLCLWWLREETQTPDAQPLRCTAHRSRSAMISGCASRCSAHSTWTQLAACCPWGQCTLQTSQRSPKEPTLCTVLQAPFSCILTASHEGGNGGTPPAVCGADPAAVPCRWQDLLSRLWWTE